MEISCLPDPWSGPSVLPCLASCPRDPRPPGRVVDVLLRRLSNAGFKLLRKWLLEARIPIQQVDTPLKVPAGSLCPLIQWGRPPKALPPAHHRRANMSHALITGPISMVIQRLELQVVPPFITIPLLHRGRR